uniref:NADH-ubiquinone oxidoreductase chain 6 n=1 Tax=Crotaphatrema lamottei TaxID=1043697 RepID=K7NBU2_CROLA|nr:NADH dehydrogenase subunit 6 [Crotaphatrema lamottei]AEK26867.1 NADH dehydrogenase subunit 6 [Crotaphatrema lamottei]
MAFMVFLGLMGLVLGMIGVASNPSPYFAALGLVVAAAAGCMILAGMGMAFLSLVLFLIYLGGMLVVFAYSSAMAAEPYPEAWGSQYVVLYMVIYFIVFWAGYGLVNNVDSFFYFENMMIRYDWGGVSMMYGVGGWMLLMSGWVLLLTLFGVLELTRGVGSSSIRAF